MVEKKTRREKPEPEVEYVGVTPEFEEILDKVMKRNRKSLEILAKH
ncbi:hypothetical protein HZC09_05270 [Candidatus Micrarchaeota archaeon]|nr:hypothetical protein [Candidatus Micrarchaeota archaeon]